jgi:hypothetical protein
MQSTSRLSPQIPPGASPVPPVSGSTRPLVEIEGDGLEGQLPPRRRAEDVPDDPSEPFSPNYGAMPAVEPRGQPEQA